MTSLRETIEGFHAYILEKDSAIEKNIVGDTSDFKHTRLGVYQEGYFLRLLEILGKEFPAVKRLAGDEQFDQLGRNYILSFPSHSYSVRYVGQHFSEFLASV